MGEEVKLLGMWASPFTKRIEFALKLKGIQYEYIEEDVSNKSPLLLKSNPVHKKVPVLIHNGKPISESLVILEYIEETWPNNPILPNNPYHRAIARFWAKFVDDKILPTGSKFATAKWEEKGQVLEEVDGLLEHLDTELKGKEYFGGEGVGYADIAVFFLTYNWFLICQEIMQREVITDEKFPFLWKWMTKFKEMDLVKECLPPKQKYLALVRSHMGHA